jgi:hypothetical protein
MTVCKCGAEFANLTGRKKYCYKCTMELKRIAQSERQRKFKNKCSDCFNCKRFDCILKVETDYEWTMWGKEVVWN